MFETYINKVKLQSSVVFSHQVRYNFTRSQWFELNKNIIQCFLNAFATESAHPSINQLINQSKKTKTEREKTTAKEQRARKF